MWWLRTSSLESLAVKVISPALAMINNGTRLNISDQLLLTYNALDFVFQLFEEGVYRPLCVIPSLTRLHRLANGGLSFLAGAFQPMLGREKQERDRWSHHIKVRFNLANSTACSKRSCLLGIRIHGWINDEDDTDLFRAYRLVVTSAAAPGFSQPYQSTHESVFSVPWQTQRIKLHSIPWHQLTRQHRIETHLVTVKKLSPHHYGSSSWRYQQANVRLTFSKGTIEVNWEHPL